MALYALPAIAQIAMGRPGMTPVPAPPKRLAAPAKPTNSSALTPDQQARLTALMKQMPAKQRKKLAKAVNHMTPEQRQQFVALVKQQLGKAPQGHKRGK